MGREDPLEEGMATHSSVLTWRIPWTEEPGGLQSMVLQSQTHDWRDLACAHAHSSTEGRVPPFTTPRTRVAPDEACVAPTSAPPPLPPGLTLLGGPLSHTPSAAQPVSVSLTPMARPCPEPARSSGLGLHVPLIKLCYNSLLVYIYQLDSGDCLGFICLFISRAKNSLWGTTGTWYVRINKCSVDNHDIGCVEKWVNIKTWLITARWNSIIAPIRNSQSRQSSFQNP